jgi:hypothetical protein
MPLKLHLKLTDYKTLSDLAAVNQIALSWDTSSYAIEIALKTDWLWDLSDLAAVNQIALSWDTSSYAIEIALGSWLTISLYLT